MSDERETPVDPGAPVEEQAASDTAVQDAVDRATGAVEDPAKEVIVVDASGAVVDSSVGDAQTAVAAGAEAFAEQAHREQAASVDTQLDIETPGEQPSRIPPVEDLPSAAAAPEVPVAAPGVQFADPARDGEIRISADHPMAALYMQSPMPPDLRGNRAAGVLIALLGAVAFAVLYAGIVSAMIARDFPPSTFLTEGLLPWVTSWGFIAGVVAFFVGLAILVLIFGRAGWWAYVIFSLFVGIIVWVATTATFALTGGPYEAVDGAKGFVETARQLAFTVPTLGAAILAREVAVWFGAWIGSRGRRMTAKNAALLEEYEAALAEVRAKQ
ncbi:MULTISPECIES: phage holin family protein [Leucobacter]|uniref:phage holin family protein n=1 Tax=Leucobacter TaxID=55968 RepID=UPI000E646C7E|nr:phage holin family protein [Leucobacter aridicollis]UTX52516.1 phage holin family protein [Leucobacter aridicollis]